jgi:hypothetical protein
VIFEVGQMLVYADWFARLRDRPGAGGDNGTHERDIKLALELARGVSEVTPDATDDPPVHLSPRVRDAPQASDAPPPVLT